MQGVNFLLPALTLPFLIRYLGPRDYGLFNLSQTWAIYFSVIIAYGFDLTATKEVAASNKSEAELNSVYSRVFYSKLLLFGLSATVFTLIIFFYGSYRADAHIYLLMFLWTLNQLFFPGFLYQGLEKQAVVTSFYIISRAGSFLIVLLFIYFKFSLLSLVLAYSLPQAFTGFIYHLLTVKRYQIKLERPALFKIIKYLKDSFVLFLSTIAGTITVSVSIILIGFFSTREAVGYFSVASKLVSLIYGMVLFPFQIVFFPIIIKTIKESYLLGLKYFVKLIGFAFLLMVVCCFTIYFSAPLIIKMFVGSGFDASIDCLRIVCFVPLFALINMLFGLLFIALERRGTYTLFQCIGMLICLVLNIILIPPHNIIGSSFAWLVAEICGFVCYLSVFIKNDLFKIYSRELLNMQISRSISFYGSKIYRKRKVS